MPCSRLMTPLTSRWGLAALTGRAGGRKECWWGSRLKRDCRRSPLRHEPPASMLQCRAQHELTLSTTHPLCYLPSLPLALFATQQCFTTAGVLVAPTAANAEGLKLEFVAVDEMVSPTPETKSFVLSNVPSGGCMAVLRGCAGAMLQPAAWCSPTGQGESLHAVQHAVRRARTVCTRLPSTIKQYSTSNAAVLQSLLLQATTALWWVCATPWCWATIRTRVWRRSASAALPAKALCAARASSTRVCAGATAAARSWPSVRWGGGTLYRAAGVQ